MAAAVAAVAAIRGVATRAALKAGGGACAAVERRRAIVIGAREGMFVEMERDGVFVGCGLRVILWMRVLICAYMWCGSLICTRG